MSTPSADAFAIDLIILAGGRGSRLGGASKPAVTVAGRTLLSRVLDARRFARQVVVVGPASARPAAGADTSDVLWALEDPPFGGPVAGIAAGLAALAPSLYPDPTLVPETPSARENAVVVASAPSERAQLQSREEDAEEAAAAWVLLLACDLPWAADAAGVLLAAASDLPDDVDGVHLVDSAGRTQWLAGVYRASSLHAAVARLGAGAHGASVHSLLAGLTLVGIQDDAGSGSDVDTWEDAAASTARLENQADDASRTDDASQSADL